MPHLLYSCVTHITSNGTTVKPVVFKWLKPWNFDRKLIDSNLLINRWISCLEAVSSSQLSSTFYCLNGKGGIRKKERAVCLSGQLDDWMLTKVLQIACETDLIGIDPIKKCTSLLLRLHRHAKLAIHVNMVGRYDSLITDGLVRRCPAD